VSPEAICGAVHEVYGSEIEKSFAAPEALEVIANREPVESVITVAVTPRLAPELVVALLMALARSVKLSPVVPVPVGNVFEAPDAVVSVKDEVGNVVEGRLSTSEYHAAVLARLLTTTV